MHGVDEVGVKELPDSGNPAAESDVLALRGLPPLFEDRCRVAPDEVERGVGECERRTRVVGHDEHRGVERGLVTPPATPLLVVPGPALGPELVATHDLGADVACVVPGEVIIEAPTPSG